MRVPASLCVSVSVYLFVSEYTYACESMRLCDCVSVYLYVCVSVRLCVCAENTRYNLTEDLIDIYGQDSDGLSQFQHDYAIVESLSSASALPASSFVGSTSFCFSSSSIDSVSNDSSSSSVSSNSSSSFSASSFSSSSSSSFSTDPQSSFSSSSSTSSHDPQSSSTSSPSWIAANLGRLLLYFLHGWFNRYCVPEEGQKQLIAFLSSFFTALFAIFDVQLLKLLFPITSLHTLRKALGAGLDTFDKYVICPNPLCAKRMNCECKTRTTMRVQ